MNTPNPTRLLQTLLLFTSLAAGNPAATAASQGQEELLNQASTLYREGRWSGAYGRFAALADQGHLEAARIAMHMLRMGPVLYGTDWGASQPQIDLWSRLASQPLPDMQSVTGD
jgi:hypothetical protein